MVKIISTFIFLLLGPGAFSLQFDLLNSSEDSDEVFISPEETKEFPSVSDVQFSVGFPKDLKKIKIISGSDFSFFSTQALPIKKISEVDQKIIPSLNITKIIYPFHSFL